MSIVDDLQTKCDTHQNGEHCWHQSGNMGYSGKFQSSCRVVCCHCGSYGTQHFDVRPNGWVEMREANS